MFSNFPHKRRGRNGEQQIHAANVRREREKRKTVEGYEERKEGKRMERVHGQE